MLPALLAWVVYLGASTALLLADPFPLRLTFVTPASFHAFVLAAESLFVIFAWPFLGGSRRERFPLGAAALVALGLPLALLAANISAAGPAALLRGQVLVFALAALVTALRPAEPGRAPAYVLAALALSAALPFAAFVAKEFGGADLGGLAALSPVWAAADILRWPGLALTSLAAVGAALVRVLEPAA